MRTELDIITHKLTKQFNEGCTRYGLLKDNDKILIGLSGGKDSMALLSLMAQRSRIFRPRIQIEAVHVVMDNIGYSSDIEYLDKFTSELGCRLNVIHASFDETTDTRKTKCFLCSWNRRKAIFSYAEENGFNKIALGHHQDDIITTLLMNMTFEGAMATMPPSMKMEHYNLTIIRPLCLAKEETIKEFAEKSGFRKQKKLCPYENATKRKAMESIFRELEDLNPEARYNLWKAMSNIQKDRLPE